MKCPTCYGFGCIACAQSGMVIEGEVIAVQVDELPDEAYLATEPPLDEQNAPLCEVQRALYLADLNTFHGALFR